MNPSNPLNPSNQPGAATGIRDKVLKVIIMIAACFAIGSVGFFIAVLLQHTAAATPGVTTIQPVVTEPSTTTKETILESLNNSSDGAKTTASTSTSTATGTHAGNTDAQKAAKLKLLQALNAH